MNYILETERLRLRELTLDDAAFIIELVNTPGWLKFIGDKNVKTEEQAKAYLGNGPIKSYREHGFGLYLVELKDSQTKIGMCGILKRDTLEHPDIGYALLPEFMEKGYALEIAHATLKYASDRLKLPFIYAIVVPENVRSIKLLNKMGLIFIKRFHFKDSIQELLLYCRKNAYQKL
jgi:RimJ/RimL family protein N-acetyltransferase